MGLAGNILGGLGISSAEALWNQKEKGRDREYATKMANTAHQREVADLKLAGLNPILSAGGRGASAPVIGSKPAPSVSSSIAGLSNASYASAAAKNQSVTATLRGDMLKFYNSNKGVQAATNAAMLSKEAGIPPIYPAAANAASSFLGNAAKGVKKWFRGKGINKGPTQLRGKPQWEPIPGMEKEYWEDSRNRDYELYRSRK